ncbi:MAG: hypothetical protein D6714_18680 [Bacteroidetes bacterium]|nr:MAG: hypothetical protein D6714_18680 [Bacteroidota bacterium]
MKWIFEIKARNEIFQRNGATQLPGSAAPEAGAGNKAGKFFPTKNTHGRLFLTDARHFSFKKRLNAHFAF